MQITLVCLLFQRKFKSIPSHRSHSFFRMKDEEKRFEKHFFFSPKHNSILVLCVLSVLGLCVCVCALQFVMSTVMC